jgi:hypothetical protein
MRENGKLEGGGKAPAGAKSILLGITFERSFISAASRFQPADGQPPLFSGFARHSGG